MYGLGGVIFSIEFIYSGSPNSNISVSPPNKNGLNVLTLDMVWGSKGMYHVILRFYYSTSAFVQAIEVRIKM